MKRSIFESLKNTKKQEVINNFITLMPDFSIKTLKHIISCSKLWILQKNIKAKQDTEANNGGVYNLKPLRDDNVHTQSSASSVTSASSANSSSKSQATKSLSTSTLTSSSADIHKRIKSAAAQGAKNYKFQQNKAAHKKLKKSHKYTKGIPIKKNPRKFNNGNDNWGKFTDDDLLKYVKDHHQ